MRKKQRLLVILPSGMADTEVKIMKGNGQSELIFELEDYEDSILNKEQYEKYFFVRDQLGRSLKIKFEEILWVEADRSYCHIFLENGKKITQSLTDRKRVV